MRVGVAHAATVATIAVVLGGAALACAPAGRRGGAAGGGRAGALTATVEAGGTFTSPMTATAPVTATAGLTATAEVTATRRPITATPGVTGTPALTPTAAGTAGATAAPTATRASTATATATATRAAGGTARPPAATASIQLPFLARQAVGASPRPAVVWGAQFTFEEDAALSAADIAAELPRLRAAGARSIRMHLRWKDVEPERRDPPAFDWSTPDRLIGAYSRAGFDVVVSIVDYPAWAMVYRCGYGYRSPDVAARWRDFVGAAAARYAAAPYRVAAWEIGNEVDGKTVVTEADRARPPEWGQDEPMPPQIGCWGDRPEAFLAFYTPAYEAVKAVDPDLPVSFGNLAYATTEIFHRDFLDRYLALPGSERFDYLGYHWFPELRDFFPAEPTGPEKYAMIAGRLSRRGLRRPIWITETYRRTAQGDAESERDQVRFLTEELPEVLACCPVGRVYWFAWTDFPGLSAGQPQRGLVRHDHTPKLAFPILAHLVDHADGAARDISTPDVIAWEFRPARSGVRTIIARSRSGAATLTIPAFARETAVVTSFPDEALRNGSCCPQRRLMPSSAGWAIPLAGTASFVRIVARP